MDNFEKMQEERIKEYEKSEIKNLCIGCGIDMGYCNPRQYCGKTYCMYKFDDSDDSDDEDNNKKN
jgi:hypothetical protein